MRYLKLYERVKKENDIIAILERDCKPFLDMITSDDIFDVIAGVLYRGVRENIDVIKKEKVLKNRTPRDLDPKISNLFDKHFKEMFGHPLRKESLFVFKKDGYYGDYGEIYGVFPIGEFTYYWSPEVDDLFSIIDSEIGYISYFNEIIYIKQFIKELSETYIDDGYENIIDQEIMILCDEYYLVNLEYMDDIIKHISER